ncbi:PucR family transcriptional regulator [Actinomadura atramentaria]|uniref:PucR family transcriptional regulator n=1 Tax=Actinomadura atramentaria TaxID=1990 RepID=UPI00037EED9A|nr:PucR family transcriptional regulator [Actinomadura atramentaria]
MTQTLEPGIAHRVPSRLPSRLAVLMRPELPGLADEIIAEIRAAIPEYGRPSTGPYVEALRIGVESALGHFVDQVANPAVPRDRHDETYRRLGRYEALEGRSLDTLQAALRVGAQVAWRRVMEVGPRRKLSTTIMAQLADALFAYIDELAALAQQGFLDARPDEELEGHRRRLLDFLVRRPGASPRVLAELAARAKWTVPDEVTPVVAAAGSPYVRSALPPDALADLSAEDPHLVFPGPLTDERRRTLAEALPEGQVAAGVTVPVEQAADSLRWARQALGLLERGILDDGPVTCCDDHLLTLWLLSDQALTEQIARRHLREMADLNARQRDRLLDTLRTWLTLRGTAADIAEELNVHPQTVRYRMRQLEAALGERLNDPDARFAIEAALRAMRLRHGARGGDGTGAEG